MGTRITGKVRNLTSFGAFVEIEAGIDGLIHISDMSWTKRVQHPSEVIKKSDEVEVVILNIDGDNKRISLGLKQAEEDPWLKIGETLPIDTEMRGHAVRMMDKGIVIDLGNDLEGFAPMSQLGLADVTDPAEVVKEGQPLDVKVLEVDPIHHRIVVAVIRYPEFTEADLVKRPPIPVDEDSESPDEALAMDSEPAEGVAPEETVAEADPDAEAESAETAPSEDAPTAVAEPAADDEPAAETVAAADPESDADAESVETTESDETKDAT